MYSIGKSPKEQQTFSQHLPFAAIRELITDTQIVGRTEGVRYNFFE